MNLLLHEMDDLERAIGEYERSREDRWAYNRFAALRELVERIGEIHDVARARAIRESMTGGKANEGKTGNSRRRAAAVDRRLH